MIAGYFFSPKKTYVNRIVLTHRHIVILLFTGFGFNYWVGKNVDNHSFYKLSVCKNKNDNMSCMYFVLHLLQKLIMNNIKISIYWISVKPK